MQNRTAIDIYEMWIAQGIVRKKNHFNTTTVLVAGKDKAGQQGRANKAGPTRQGQQGRANKGRANKAGPTRQGQQGRANKAGQLGRPIRQAR